MSRGLLAEFRVAAAQINELERLESRDRKGDSEPLYDLFFVDGSKPAETLNAAPAGWRSAYSARRTPAARQRGVSQPNDHITYLWPEGEP
jgi:hypothetical protein